MGKSVSLNYEEANPNPEYLIKSIAEQGYSLKTALADLIDNSISANSDKVEILTNIDDTKYTLFLADNGDGMDKVALRESMHFPSDSPESSRNINDLGRFGLGMKTASFSQTRRFTILSRKTHTTKFSGYTWDVEFLKEKKSWLMIINSDEEIAALLDNYKNLSTINHLNQFNDFNTSTIVVWQGLYKFEKYLSEKNRKTALNREITEVTSNYLSLVFHRFMEKKKNALQIRINNKQLKPFNPFPTNEVDFRSMEYKQKPFSTDHIKIEGFVLPCRSIEETRQGKTMWVMPNAGLMDMEGIYIYRANRIIIYGGWNGLIKKAPRLQLARLRVEVGNKIDHLLHLNVAKSQVSIPHDLQKSFENYIEELKIQAEREFYNRGIRKFPNKVKGNNEKLFEKLASNKGSLIEVNLDFPLIASFKEGLGSEKLSQLNVLIRMINTSINKIRNAHEDKVFIETDQDNEITRADLLLNISKLKSLGMSSEAIKNEVLSGLGYKLESLPEEVNKLLGE